MSTTQVTSDSCPATDRTTGQVKWFNTKAGYGFITVCEGEHSGKDIFVHYSSIKVVNSQYRYLVQGEYVDFSIVKPENDKYEFHAVEVSGVKGGLIMCETRRASYDNQPRGRVNVRRYRTQKEDGDDVDSSRKRPVSGDDTGFEKVVKKRTVRGRAPTPK